MRVRETGEVGVVDEITAWSGRMEWMVDLGSEQVGFQPQELVRMA